MGLVAADTKSEFPFMRLPAELRLEIYRMILTGETIHIAGLDQRGSQSRWAYRLFYRTCSRNPEFMESLSRLVGAGHSQDQSSATSHGTQMTCFDAGFWRSDRCNHHVRLDVQLLRVCRQIHDEAALLLFAENHFTISHKLDNRFQKAFVTEISSERRGAMQTVAMSGNREADIGLLPALLPGLKRLWFGVSHGTYDFEQPLAIRQSKRVEAFSQIKLRNLIGVTVECGWISSRSDGHDDDDGMEKRLELALLGK